MLGMYDQLFPTKTSGLITYPYPNPDADTDRDGQESCPPLVREQYAASDIIDNSLVYLTAKEKWKQ